MSLILKIEVKLKKAEGVHWERLDKSGISNIQGSVFIFRICEVFCPVSVAPLKLKLFQKLIKKNLFNVM